jgi:hypothetical protein
MPHLPLWLPYKQLQKCVPTAELMEITLAHNEHSEDKCDYACTHTMACCVSSEISCFCQNSEW